MKNLSNNFKKALLIEGPTILAMVWLTLAGCSRHASIDEAPLEVRGQPINQGPATNTRIVEVGRAIGSAAVATNLSAKASPATPGQSQVEPFATIGFEQLAGYLFDLPDDLLAPPSNQVAQATAKTEAQIPANVKAFDKRRVALKGFMLPLKVEGGKVTELLVMKDQSACCFGAVPKINEWVSVKMAGAGVKPFMDQPVTFYGTLHVGETRENGYLVGIYSMDGERIDDLPDR